VLVIRASPLHDGHSNRITDRFLEVLRKHRPEVEIIDWWLHEKHDIPEFGQAVINGKQADAGTRERVQWFEVLSTIVKFKRADKYVISTPMWNFGIPTKLKNLIDVLVQSDLTFEDDENGTRGLVIGKKVLFVCARADAYKAGSEFDFQLPYLQKVLAFIGVQDQKIIKIENTWMGAKSDEEPLRVAEELASHF